MHESRARFIGVDNGNLFSRKEALSSGLELLVELWGLCHTKVALEYHKHSVFPFKLSIMQYFG